MTAPRNRNLLRLLLTTAIMVAIPSLAATAEAQEFGQQGVLVISAENIFGFGFGERQWELNNFSTEIDFDLFGFGWGFGLDPGNTTPLVAPRFAIDGFVIDGLSVGGSIGFAFVDSNDNDNNTNDQEGFGFLLSPRVGYAYMFTDWAGIWGRGGFTYYTFDDEFLDRDQLSLDLEGIFVLAPTESFGFLVGPMAHIGLSGEWRGGNNEVDYTEWVIGVTVGLAGWIGL